MNIKNVQLNDLKFDDFKINRNDTSWKYYFVIKWMNVKNITIFWVLTKNSEYKL